jgi:hypothetical protein
VMRKIMIMFLMNYYNFDFKCGDECHHLTGEHRRSRDSNLTTDGAHAVLQSIMRTQGWIQLGLSLLVRASPRM